MQYQWGQRMSQEARGKKILGPGVCRVRVLRFVCFCLFLVFFLVLLFVFHRFSVFVFSSSSSSPFPVAFCLWSLVASWQPNGHAVRISLASLGFWHRLSVSGNFKILLSTFLQSAYSRQSFDRRTMTHLLGQAWLSTPVQ